MRILHVILTLSRGGAERQLVNIVTNTNEDIEHLVCYMRKPHDYVEEIKTARCRVIELGVENKYGWWNAAVKISDLTKSFRPDLIHSWMFDGSFAARLAQIKIGRIPMITSIQNVDYEEATIKGSNLSPLKIKILNLIDKYSGLMTKPVFVPCSEFVSKSAVRHLKIPEERTRVIYNAVNTDALMCSPDAVDKLRREFNLPDNALIFLNVGRLDPQKAQAVLLRAFARLRQKAESARLLIAGGGALENYLRDLAAELGIKEAVLFLGKRTDIGALYELADVFVFPSLFEGFSLALVEAMSKGKACIVSSIEPNREAVKDEENGLLVAPNNVDELFTAMHRLYCDSQLRRVLGESALTTVNRKFHNHIIVQQWEQLYGEIAAGRF